MKNIIIIGATSGIGNALSRALSTTASLYLTGRQLKNLDGINYSHFEALDVTTKTEYS